MSGPTISFISRIVIKLESNNSLKCVQHKVPSRCVYFAYASFFTIFPHFDKKTNHMDLPWWHLGQSVWLLPVGGAYWKFPAANGWYGTVLRSCKRASHALLSDFSPWNLSRRSSWSPGASLWQAWEIFLPSPHTLGQCFGELTVASSHQFLVPEEWHKGCSVVW